MLTVKPRLREILKERGITQEQLSKMTGIPQPSISRFDKNKQHLNWHLFSIAGALELLVEELFVIEE
ncbi:helix-turn-helix domain-containing protein [Priestia megaterium]|uniref:helix-turn-helix domain-containing protein n=1 Tax=Priestia megaterium TaxID=1404 RepID=UPI0034E2142B